MSIAISWSDVLIGGLTQGAIYFLVTVGLNLILGVLGLLNLAHGAVVAFGTYAALSAAEYAAAQMHLGATETILLMLAVGAAVGAALGLALHFGLFSWLLRREEVDQMIATFAAMLIMEDAIKWIWPQQVLSAPWSLVAAFGTFTLGGITYTTIRLLVFAGAIGVAALLYLVLYKTRFGLVMRSLSVDQEVLRAYGLKVALYFAAAVAFACAISALGGALVGLVRVASPALPAEFLAIAFAIAVIGGLGSISGALIASFLVSFLEALVVQVYPELSVAVLYAVMVAVLLVKPEGLMGRREVRVA